MAATSSRFRAPAVVPGTIVVCWLVVVVVAGVGGRVVDQWASSLTMLFGSFLGGSSPVGSGAVAFPVFTKALDIPGPVARTFGLCIQTVGLGVAAISIRQQRRPIHGPTIAVAAPAGIAGLVVGLVLLGDPTTTFWEPVVGSAWIKATFSIVLATTALLMVLHLRDDDAAHVPMPWGRRPAVAVGLAGVVGGLLSSVTGTGANIVVFVVLVVVLDVDPRVALPTAVTLMALVSAAGFVLLGLVDAQLDVAVTAGRVVSVGGEMVDLDAGRADLLGLWLAAVPVVVWGAPLGSWVASRVREHDLVRFIAGLAAFEVVTTVVLVPELRREPALLAFLVAGLVALPTLLLGLRRHRRAIFGHLSHPSQGG